VTLAAIAAIVASVAGGVASPLPSLSLLVAPQPLVTTGENVLGILKFSYDANASPTTITKVYELVTITPALTSTSQFKGAPLSTSGCKLTDLGTVSSTVRCDFGNLTAGAKRTVFVVVSAASSAPTEGTTMKMQGTAYWNENLNGTNPQPNNSVSTAEVTTKVFPGTGVVNENGKCTVGGASLETSTAFGVNNQQATHVDYPANAQGFPCTPASIQDDQTAEANDGICAGGVRACKFSQIVLPLLSVDTFATDVITFDGSLFPSPGSGPNPTKFRVLELLDPPDPTTDIVPLCSSGTRSPGGACEMSAVKYGTRGIQVVLSVRGSLIDPRYGG
jgi:hypothetical protein